MTENEAISVHVVINNLDRPLRCPAVAWPAWLAAKLRERGIRMKPLPMIAPTLEQVHEAIEPPWEMWDDPAGGLHFAQGDDALNPA